MNIKYHTINENGCSIRCKMFCDDWRDVRRAVLYAHGFGGHKETRAAVRFSEAALSKQKGTLVMAFDWPCHGEDARKKLKLADCSEYLGICTEYLSGLVGEENVYANATSFGAYLLLRYLQESGNPFRRITLRSPAVIMYQVLTQNIMNDDNHRDISRGKETLVGFDRKIRIGADFLRELEENDITKQDFTAFSEDILIVHGMKDEIVPVDAVRVFAEENLIEFVPVEKADHRFIDPNKMSEAVARMVSFLFSEA